MIGTAEATDAAVEELVEGFGHLITGLRSVIQNLRDENVALHARLDERRLAAEAATTSSPPAQEMFMKTCEGCHDPFKGSRRRRFCTKCFSMNASQRIRTRMTSDQTPSLRRVAS